MQGLKSSRILITGGSGFIGTHLVRKLAELGIYPLAVTRRDPSRNKIERIRYLKANLASPKQVKGLFLKAKRTDIVVHLAARLPNAKISPEEAWENIQGNVLTTMNILKYLPKDIKQFIYISTLDVYGPAFFLPMNESHPTNPTTYYGAAKLATEKYLQIFFKSKKSTLTILRLSNVYGPGEKKLKAIPIFLDRILNDKRPIVYGRGEDIRDYVYVEDVVEAIILSMHKMAGGIFNIAMGKGHSLKEVLNLICKICKKDIRPVYKPRRKELIKLVFDISHAKRALGYFPSYDLEQGLRCYIENLQGA